MLACGEAKAYPLDKLPPDETISDMVGGIQIQVAFNAGSGTASVTDSSGQTIPALRNAKARFPNLRLVYLGSRIYGGYGTSALNPEPYAYESAFVCRWLIQDQIKGTAELNYDPKRGPVKAPLLLWGPYLWGDGVTPRREDKLVWSRADFAGDGTHPSQSGREKVARLLLDFCRTDPLAKLWFAKSGAH